MRRQLRNIVCVDPDEVWFAAAKSAAAGILSDLAGRQGSSPHGTGFPMAKQRRPRVCREHHRSDRKCMAMAAPGSDRCALHHLEAFTDRRALNRIPDTARAPGAGFGRGGRSDASATPRCAWITARPGSLLAAPTTATRLGRLGKRTWGSGRILTEILRGRAHLDRSRCHAGRPRGAPPHSTQLASRIAPRWQQASRLHARRSTCTRTLNRTARRARSLRDFSRPTSVDLSAEFGGGHSGSECLQSVSRSRSRSRTSPTLIVAVMAFP